MNWEEYDEKQCYECRFFIEKDLSGRGECEWLCKECNGFDFACAEYEEGTELHEKE